MPNQVHQHQQRTAGTRTARGHQVQLHCPKSNPNFPDITRIVDKNDILHEIFREVLVSRFPRYISCYISENRLPLGQCTVHVVPATLLKRK